MNTTYDMKVLQQHANRGDAWAQNNLGVRYQFGRGVAQDDVQAVAWYRKAAEQGEATAQNNLGAMYGDGRGVAQDDVQAVAWYRKAAEQGDARGQFNLGAMYGDGRGVAQDDVQAVAWYRKAAEQGEATAQNNLGVRYQYGRGVAQDDVQAVAWYRKAAEQGDARGQNNLGAMYQDGRGVAQDDVQAVAWYRKAAEQGDARGQNNLGAMYQDGRGVAQDDVQAVAWYRKAAEQGDARGQFNLGAMYQDGRGVAQDDVQAVAWYRKAAEQGDARGQFNLGVRYQYGRGVAQDDVQAVAWYRKAAEQGEATAQINLGAMYGDGRGVAQDDVQAVAWYRKAAEQGVALGQYNLGCMYLHGLGAVKDVDMARRWFEAVLTNAQANDMDKSDARQALTGMNSSSVKREFCTAELKATTFSDGSSSASDSSGEDDLSNTTLDLADALADLDAMIGLNGVKAEIRKLADYVQVQQKRRSKGRGARGGPPSLHLVFSGNPGTGKTTMARKVGELYRAMGMLKKGHVVEVKREDVVAEYIGQTAPKMKDKIQEAMDGVLFIDEAYTLSPQDHFGSDFGKEAIATLLAEMENNRDRLAVIVAGYTNEMRRFIASNPGLKSRFTRYVEFEDYDAEALTAIFETMAADQDYVLSAPMRDALLQYFGEMYARRDDHFGNAREARNLIEQVIQNHSGRDARGEMADHEADILTPEDIPGFFEARVDPDAALEQAFRKVNAMIGLDGVKGELKMLADYVRVQKQRLDQGLKTPELSLHLVFTGNPGTGKTTVARHVGAIYQAMGMLKKGHVVEVKREDVVAEYIGQTAPKMKDKIQEAMDGVLFIDEAYTLSPPDHLGNDFGKEAIATLLAEMENNRHRLAVIVAGYGDEMVEFIASNPGLKSRFTRHIEFEDYTPEELVKIFKFMAEGDEYVVSEELSGMLMRYFAKLHGQRVKDFGNGRVARNILEGVLQHHARRIVRLGRVERGDLITLTENDFVSLGG